MQLKKPNLLSRAAARAHYQQLAVSSNHFLHLIVLILYQLI